MSHLFRILDILKYKKRNARYTVRGEYNRANSYKKGMALTKSTCSAAKGDLLGVVVQIPISGE